MGFARLARLALGARRLRACIQPLGARALCRFLAAALATAAVTATLAGARLGVARGVVLLRGLGCAGEPAQVAQVEVVQVHPDPALEAARQHHRTIANADEPAHRMADGLE